jgi:hypothetical protein
MVLKLKLKQETMKEIFQDSQLVYLWELNHEKDIKQVVNWRDGR